MFKKTISICLALILTLGLTACGGATPDATTAPETEAATTTVPLSICDTQGHTWKEATCETAGVCTVCGETQGEALGHAWVEANYQTPKTCSACGVSEGEPLTAYYAEYGLEERLLDKSGTYVLSLPCYYDAYKTTTGIVTVVDYTTFASDETHEALEGYEWRILTVSVRFADENAAVYGVNGFMRLSSNYYESDGASEPPEDGEYQIYSVTWQGKTFAECAMTYGGGWSDWMEDENGNHAIECTCIFTYRVPVGYDGAVAGVADMAMTMEPGSHMHENINDSTLLFRLD